MTADTPNSLALSLQGKKIGLLACTESMQADFGGALMLVQASSAAVDAYAVPPGSRELDQYDALVLHVEELTADLSWYWPEALRNNTRPLLLAGEPRAIYASSALQSHVDDVLMGPFSPAELVFRLRRLAGLGAGRGRTVAQSVAIKPCVLVADDDPAIVFFVNSWLQNFDLDAHFVSDGSAAVYAARRLMPDLLLLDVDMPVLNGLDVLRTLRKEARTRGLVTVMLTASSDASDVTDGFDLGVVDYIVKPFSHFDLTRKLRALLKLDPAASFKHASNGRPFEPAKPPAEIDTPRSLQNRWKVLFGERHSQHKVPDAR